MSTPTARSRLVTQLEQRIMDRELNSGAMLPSERDLASDFNVGRTSVREAIRELAERGLVEIQPGRGTFVTRPSPASLAPGLGLWARRSGVTPRQIIDARIMIESDSAAKAARHGSTAKHALMAAILERLDGSASPVVAARLDVAFHLCVARLSANPVSELLLTSLTPLTADLVAVSMNVPDVVTERAQQHQAILSAIVAGDPEAARAAMTQHLAYGESRFPGYDQPMQGPGVIAGTPDLDDLLSIEGLPAWDVPTQDVGTDVGAAPDLTVAPTEESQA